MVPFTQQTFCKVLTSICDRFEDVWPIKQIISFNIDWRDSHKSQVYHHMNTDIQMSHPEKRSFFYRSKNLCDSKSLWGWSFVTIMVCTSQLHALKLSCKKVTWIYLMFLSNILNDIASVNSNYLKTLDIRDIKTATYPLWDFSQVSWPRSWQNEWHQIG